jgi:MHS family proline/betaine transporter-like MFS transporter
MLQERSLFFRLMTASSVGTILEWYDFSLFAFLTPILATLYFPHENKLTALMLTYVIFAIGFLVRPLGAILFGHLGDRIGRKKTLIFSIVLMSLSTFCIGILPTYSQVGIFAPILLIFLRLCQGLSVGGESTGAVLFVLESLPKKNHGLLSATLWSMTGVGMLLGSLFGSIAMQFSAATMAWRIPFLLGLMSGIIGYFMRQQLPESMLFQKAKSAGMLVKFPLRRIVTTFRRALFITIGLYMLSAMITYLIFVFMPSYAANIIGLSLAQTSMISTLGLLCVTLLVPLGGYLADKWGAKKSLYGGALGFLLLSYPLFYLISRGFMQNYITAEIVFVLLAANFQGAITVAVLEMLPISVRYSIAAIGYNLSYSIFGGTAPLLASYLVRLTGDKAAPGICLTVGALIALLSAKQLKSEKK